MSGLILRVSLLPLLALAVLVVSLPAMAAMEPHALPFADEVIVHKGERRLYLKKQGEVLRGFDIRLGLSPNGHKRMEGDFRTPEGRYALAERNFNSDFFLSIRISYPGPDDVRRAAELGVEPGGQIMIHGLPNRLSRPLDYYRERDWTEGCIAVSNEDMIDIWLMTREGTPIKIHP